MKYAILILSLLLLSSCSKEEVAEPSSIINYYSVRIDANHLWPNSRPQWQYIEYAVNSDTTILQYPVTSAYFNFRSGDELYVMTQSISMTAQTPDAASLWIRVYESSIQQGDTGVASQQLIKDTIIFAIRNQFEVEQTFNWIAP